MSDHRTPEQNRERVSNLRVRIYRAEVDEIGDIIGAPWPVIDGTSDPGTWSWVLLTELPWPDSEKGDPPRFKDTLVAPGHHYLYRATVVSRLPEGGEIEGPARLSVLCAASTSSTLSRTTAVAYTDGQPKSGTSVELEDRVEGSSVRAWDLTTEDPVGVALDRDGKTVRVIDSGNWDGSGSVVVSWVPARAVILSAVETDGTTQTSNEIYAWLPDGVPSGFFWLSLGDHEAIEEMVGAPPLTPEWASTEIEVDSVPAVVAGSNELSVHLRWRESGMDLVGKVKEIRAKTSGSSTAYWFRSDGANTGQVAANLARSIALQGLGALVSGSSVWVTGPRGPVRVYAETWSGSIQPGYLTGTASSDILVNSRAPYLNAVAHGGFKVIAHDVDVIDGNDSDVWDEETAGPHHAFQNFYGFNGPETGPLADDIPDCGQTVIVSAPPPAGSGSGDFLYIDELGTIDFVSNPTKYVAGQISSEGMEIPENLPAAETAEILARYINNLREADAIRSVTVGSYETSAGLEVPTLIITWAPGYQAAISHSWSPSIEMEGGSRKPKIWNGHRWLWDVDMTGAGEGSGPGFGISGGGWHLHTAYNLNDGDDPEGTVYEWGINGRKVLTPATGLNTDVVIPIAIGWPDRRVVLYLNKIFPDGSRVEETRVKILPIRCRIDPFEGWGSGATSSASYTIAVGSGNRELWSSAFLLGRPPGGSKLYEFYTADRPEDRGITIPGPSVPEEEAGWGGAQIPRTVVASTAVCAPIWGDHPGGHFPHTHFSVKCWDLRGLDPTTGLINPAEPVRGNFSDLSTWFPVQDEDPARSVTLSTTGALPSGHTVPWLASSNGTGCTTDVTADRSGGANLFFSAGWPNYAGWAYRSPSYGPPEVEVLGNYHLVNHAQREDSPQPGNQWVSAAPAIYDGSRTLYIPRQEDWLNDFPCWVADDSPKRLMMEKRMGSSDYKKDKLEYFPIWPADSSNPHFALRARSVTRKNLPDTYVGSGSLEIPRGYSRVVVEPRGLSSPHIRVRLPYAASGGYMRIEPIGGRSEGWAIEASEARIEMPNVFANGEFSYLAIIAPDRIGYLTVRNSSENIWVHGLRGEPAVSLAGLGTDPSQLTVGVYGATRDKNGKFAGTLYAIPAFLDYTVWATDGRGEPTDALTGSVNPVTWQVRPDPGQSVISIPRPARGQYRLYARVIYPTVASIGPGDRLYQSDKPADMDLALDTDQRFRGTTLETVIDLV